MRKYYIPQPQRVRKITGAFAWLDHRLLRNGYLQILTHQDLALYVFLVLVADRHGISFYRKEKICQHLQLDWGEFEEAKNRLIDFKLIAFEPYSAFNPNGFYQVLPVDQPAPDLAKPILDYVMGRGPTPGSSTPPAPAAGKPRISCQNREQLPRRGLL